MYATLCTQRGDTGQSAPPLPRRPLSNGHGSSHNSPHHSPTVSPMPTRVPSLKRSQQNKGGPAADAGAAKMVGKSGAAAAGSTASSQSGGPPNLPLPPIPNPPKSGDPSLTYVKVDVAPSNTRPLPPTGHGSHTEYSKINFQTAQANQASRLESPLGAPSLSALSSTYDIPPGARGGQPTGFSDSEEDDEEDLDLELGPLPDSMRRPQVLGSDSGNMISPEGAPPPLPHKHGLTRTPNSESPHPHGGAVHRPVDRQGGHSSHSAATAAAAAAGRADPFVDHADYDQPLPAIPNAHALYDRPPPMDDERHFFDHPPAVVHPGARHLPQRQAQPQTASPLEVELIQKGYNPVDVKKALEVAPTDRALALMILERFSGGSRSAS